MPRRTPISRVRSSTFVVMALTMPIMPTARIGSARTWITPPTTLSSWRAAARSA